MNRVVLSRREFLVTSASVAGGMALSLLPVSFADAAEPLKVATEPGELSPWIAIQPDDTVIVRVPTPEIGNGSMTQVAMNVTEELECAWSKVKVEFCEFAREFRRPGSYSVGMQPFFGGHGTDHDRMKHALQLGASARERLKAAAAARWQVPVEKVEARDGLLKYGDRVLRYGEVAEEAASIKLVAEPRLKEQSQWRFLGKASPHKINLPEMVIGKTVFGIDVRLPGMVYAALLQSPVHGGRLKHHEPGKVMGMPGVRAVVVIDPRKTPGSPVKADPTFGFKDSELRSGVAVIADHYWQAKKALEALPVEWDDRLGAFWESNEQIYAKQEEVLGKKAGKPLTRAGDVRSVVPEKIVEGVYRTPFCDNATMEPLNGTAMVTKDSAEVWHPCQDMQQAFWVAVDESGMAPERVQLHQTYVGGGFGRRVIADDVRAVVAVAKQFPGVPVKVIWSREETTRQGQYRTLIGARYLAALNRKGLPESLEGETCFSGMQLNLGYSDNMYVASGNIPNVRLTTSKFPLHVATGAYRGPCYNSHAFTVETFIDECAIAAGIDPLKYRLKLLGSWDRSRNNCLKVAARKSGWGKSLPKGQGRGVAISNWPHAGEKQKGATVCAVAHVEVTPQGELKVYQIDFTFDCGRVVNRDAVAAQLEGGVVFALNMSLNEEITIKNGAVVEGNFDTYPIIRMKDMPRINIHFDALSGHDRFGIIGEAPVGPVGPAIGNAIFQATGKRIRSMPFRKHDLKWA